MNTENHFAFATEHLEMAPFLGDEQIQFAVVDIDTENGCVDVVVKFGKNSRSPKHKHLSAVTSLVLEGEHLIYHDPVDGKQEVETRQAGSFTRSDAGGTHLDGGGAAGATVWFNFRSKDGAIYQILDPQNNIVDSISMADLM